MYASEGQGPCFRAFQNRLCKRMIEAIKMRFAGAPGKLIKAKRNTAISFRERSRKKAECGGTEKFGVAAQFMPGGPNEELFKFVERTLGFASLFTKFFADFVVEILKQLPPGLGHRLVDFEAQFELELVKRRLDLFRLRHC